MNRVQNKQIHNIEKPFPGCLGRMANLFDLTTGVTGNRLLADKPHHDASLSRSQSDVTGILSPPLGDQIEDKLILSNLARTFSKNNINGTPIKMLIDQEMSKDIDSKRSPPNVVARLMGLEAFPHEDPNLVVQKSHRKDFTQHTCGHSEKPSRHWQLEGSFMDKQMVHEVHNTTKQVDYKDIHEIWHQPRSTSHVREKTPERGRRNQSQKIMEASHLSSDETMCQSKEVEGALEVLSSNKDLLLKFLASQNLCEFQSTPPPETKRITILKPSKMMDNDKSPCKVKNDKPVKKPANVGQAAVWDKRNHGYSLASQRVDEYPAQPTRIVVLKPSFGKIHESKAVVTPTSSSSQDLQIGSFYQEPGNDALGSRKAAQESTEQMQENPQGLHRDETLYSSVFSNGYTGDESSFNQSENEYAAGNYSDSEFMSPSPRHSWDYINRTGSPYSSSSFGRASISLESSVCREAKKRLSERWAMMASNMNPQEQNQARRSSTLGEMLALSDMKKSAVSQAEVVIKDQEPRESVSCKNNFDEEHVGDSPKNLFRSKSVPVSSNVYETAFNVEVYNSEVGNMPISKKLSKSKSLKSSFKGKVTSLFFSRNKRSSKERSSLSESKNESQSTVVETSKSPSNFPGIRGDDLSRSFNSGGFGDRSLHSLCDPSSKSSSHSVSKGQKGLISLEPGLTVSKPGALGMSNQIQDQPSPISVLEPPFEDDNAARESSDCMKAGQLGEQGHLKSNLIDKSPPIESVARILSWDGSCAEVASSDPLKPLMTSLDPVAEEQDSLVLVQKLLSVSGLDDQVLSDSFYSRWYSPESPLDPTLRDRYANLNGQEPLQEAKRRQQRSTQMLIFDYVSAVLMEISGYGSEKYLMRRMCRQPEGASTLLMDLILSQTKEMTSSGMKFDWGDGGDSNGMMVEMVVRKEVAGKGWFELKGLEIDLLGREIEGKMLEELVEEAVVDLTVAFA
ncbi:uncharacterized protein LOC129306152 isoform X2 [Prosopis cineraria]|uniref:uncharacterized protein LOC129306152 isoform X2 n=1 Tax=Prosopis cineraria TaxID=364024 RepID=UPI00240EF0C9|nr:uncharacterized protein LOC129306152 isoform X2 [Prosopis cineraria]